MQVDQLSVNLFTANIAIQRLVLKNPAGWPVEQIVELREFRVDVNFSSLLGQRFTTDEMVLDVARVTLMKDPRGALNVLAFQEALTGNAAAGPARPATTSLGFLIKHLVLKIDLLDYADFSGPQPSVKEYNLNLSRDLREVDNGAKILSSFSGSTLGLVTNAMGGLLKNQPDLLRELASPLQEASKKAGKKLNGLLDSLDMRRP